MNSHPVSNGSTRTLFWNDSAFPVSVKKMILDGTPFPGDPAAASAPLCLPSSEPATLYIPGYADFSPYPIPFMTQRHRHAALTLAQQATSPVRSPVSFSAHSSPVSSPLSLYMPSASMIPRTDHAGFRKKSKAAHIICIN